MKKGAWAHVPPKSNRNGRSDGRTRARQRVLEKFSLDAEANAIAEVYRTVV